MKLYNRQEFLALPAGAVFAKYEPHCFGEFQIKGSTLPYNDFNYQEFVSLNTDAFEDWCEACESFEAGKQGDIDFYDWRRDGLYETDEILFAVLNSDEVRGLILRLANTLDEGYK